jgi:serine/threonine protein kinase
MRFETAEGVAVADTQLALTRPGTIIGTPQYMAPEQIRGGPADARTDLFATGAILYEMLAGHAAFRAASQLALADKILRTDPPMLAGAADRGSRSSGPPSLGERPGRTIRERIRDGRQSTGRACLWRRRVAASATADARRSMASSARPLSTSISA